MNSTPVRLTISAYQLATIAVAIPHQLNGTPCCRIQHNVTPENHSLSFPIATMGRRPKQPPIVAQDWAGNSAPSPQQAAPSQPKLIYQLITALDNGDLENSPSKETVRGLKALRDSEIRAASPARAPPAAEGPLAWAVLESDSSPPVEATRSNVLLARVLLLTQALPQETSFQCSRTTTIFNC